MSGQLTGPSLGDDGLCFLTIAGLVRSRDPKMRRSLARRLAVSIRDRRQRSVSQEESGDEFEIEYAFMVFFGIVSILM